MSDEPRSVKPHLPAVAAAPATALRAVVRLRIGPSPEILQFLRENPGRKLTIRVPGDPDNGESSAEVAGPALSIRSWREDKHVCSHCSRPFSVAYGNPPDQARSTHNVAVRCPACSGVVAVAVPADILAEEMDVRGGVRDGRR